MVAALQCLALQKLKAAVREQEQTAGNMPRLTPAASIRQVASSFLKLSTRCINGTRMRNYATAYLSDINSRGDVSEELKKSK